MTDTPAHGDGREWETTTTSVVAMTGTAGRATRRGLLVLVLVVVVLAAGGVLGVRSAEVSGTAEGYTLSLVYPRVARSGLDARWQVTVRHPGGFDDDLVLAVTADYFDIWETQAFHPAPDAETSDGEFLYLTFAAPPAGDIFRVDFDAYIQPASQLGRTAEVRLLDGPRTVVGVDYRTWLVP